MQKKQQIISPIKINRDLTPTKFPSDAAFNITNMKVIANEELSTLSIETEHGNTYSTSLPGTILGVQPFDDFAIVFTRYSKGIPFPKLINNNIALERGIIAPSVPYTMDYILKVFENEYGNLTYNVIYSGDLNFSLDNPIESIRCTETIDINKVYWVDGRNQLRSVNIAKPILENDPELLINKFDYLKPITINNIAPIDVEILKSYTGGNFKLGAMQYFINFSDPYGSSSNVVYASPIVHNSGLISYNNTQYEIGLDTNTTSSNCFTLSINFNTKINWEYFNIYRLQRATLDGTPELYLIYQGKINNNSDTDHINQVYTKETGETDIIINSASFGNTSVDYNDALIKLFTSQQIENGDVVYLDEYRFVDPKDTSEYLSYNNCFVIRYTDKLKDNKLVLSGLSENKSITIEVPYSSKSSTSSDYSNAIIIETDGTDKYTSLSVNNILRVARTYYDSNLDEATLDDTEDIVFKTGQVTNIEYRDTGTSIATADLSVISQKTPIIPGTLAAKDNVLFLGNIKYNKSSENFNADTRKLIKNNAVFNWFLEEDNSIDDSPISLNSQYILNSALSKPNNKTTYFKRGNTYRFGIRFMDKYGVWSDVLHIGDFKNTDLSVVPTKFNDGILKRPLANVSIDTYTLKKANLNSYIAAQLVCVYPTELEREVLCQGLTLNTLYHYGDRRTNSPYSFGDWFARPSFHNWYNFNIRAYNRHVNAARRLMKLGFYNEYRTVWQPWNQHIDAERDYYYNDDNTLKEIVAHIPSNVYGIRALPPDFEYNAENQFSHYNVALNTVYGITWMRSAIDNPNNVRNLDINYAQFKTEILIDRNIVDIFSPETCPNFSNLSDSLGSKLSNDYKFRIVGYAPVKNNDSEFQLLVDNPYGSGVWWDNYKVKVTSKSSFTQLDPTSRITFPTWLDIVCWDHQVGYPMGSGGSNQYIWLREKYGNNTFNAATQVNDVMLAGAFPLYPFQKNGALNNWRDGQAALSNLKYKWLSNFRTCLPTRYLEEPYNFKDSKQISFFNSTQENANIRFEDSTNNNRFYRGNYSKILIPENAPAQGIANTSTVAYLAVGPRANIYNVDKETMVIGADIRYNPSPVYGAGEFKSEFLSDGWNVYRSTFDNFGTYFQIPEYTTKHDDGREAHSQHTWSWPIQFDYVYIENKTTPHFTLSLGQEITQGGNYNIMMPSVWINANKVKLKIGDYENDTFIKFIHGSFSGPNPGYCNLHYNIPSGGIGFKSGTYNDNIQMEVYTTAANKSVVKVYIYHTPMYKNDYFKVSGDAIKRPPTILKDCAREASNVEYFYGIPYERHEAYRELQNSIWLPYQFSREDYKQGDPDEYARPNQLIGASCIVLTPQIIGQYDNFKIKIIPAFGTPYINGQVVTDGYMVENSFIQRIDVELMDKTTKERELRTFRFCGGRSENDAKNPKAKLVEEQSGSYSIYGIGCSCTRGAIMKSLDINYEKANSTPNYATGGYILKHGLMYAGKRFPLGNGTNLLYQDQYENSINGFIEPCIWTQDESLEPYTTNLGYYLIGEIYKDIPSDKVLGGNTEQSLENNTWLPCGNVVYFDIINDNKVDLIADTGDTYYQRYDCLHSYPAKHYVNINEISDTVSFMCETYLNIDGNCTQNRADLGKGSDAVTPRIPSTVNFFEKVYNQKNNINPATFLPESYIYSSEFPNTIRWSTPKVYGEYSDNWLNFNDINSYDINPEHGTISELLLNDNTLYCFQETCISRILYNQRVGLGATDNTPIELGLSGAVTGIEVLTNNIGTTSKWTIITTEQYIMFIDTVNKKLYMMRGAQIEDLSTNKLVGSWFKSNVSNKPWSPNNSEIKVLYDKKENIVYFTLNGTSLLFNTKLNEFVSTASYEEDMRYLIQTNNNSYKAIITKSMTSSDSSIWKDNSNPTYSMYYGKKREYSIEIIANENFNVDKVFDSVEFYTNGVEGSKMDNTTRQVPFYRIEASNEYQSNLPINSTETFNNSERLKKKFRAWRWEIGRNNDAKLKGDRIRGNWCKIKLVGNDPKKVSLYNIGVNYYI